MQSKLPDAEIEICRRLRDVREELYMSQPEFAARLGIDRGRLASYENLRAPVRYGLGSDVCHFFDINQRWLAEGLHPKYYCVPIDLNFAETLPRKALFSRVYIETLKPFIVRHLQDMARDLGCKVENINPADARLRIGVVSWVGAITPEVVLQYLVKLHRDTVGVVPQHLLSDYYAVVSKAVREFLGEHPRESQKKVLDSALPELKFGAVTAKGNSLWRQLQLRLQSATAARGMRTALAKRFGVTQSAVTQWLSGDNSPTAETTLRLLQWVGQQEKTLGSATNTAKGKRTRARKSSHENPTQGPP